MAFGPCVESGILKLKSISPEPPRYKGTKVLDLLDNIRQSFLGALVVKELPAPPSLPPPLTGGLASREKPTDGKELSADR